nr:hypothetical protein [uncultured Bacteroides sp.]
MNLFELFIEGYVANTVGLYSRYYFFWLLGKKKNINYLSGKGKDKINNASQIFFNSIIGLLVLALALLGLFSLYFSIFE